MTAFGLTPAWNDEDWTGFLLLIVPAARLPIPGRLLARLVRDQIETDPALYDLVTVADGPSPDEFPGRADWERAFLSRLVEAAMPQRQFLAPRGVLAVIVVGESDRDLQRVGAELLDLQILERLKINMYQCLIKPEDGPGGIDTKTVRVIAALAPKLIKRHDEGIVSAIEELPFLAEVGGLLERRLVSWENPPPEQPRQLASATPRTDDGCSSRPPAAFMPPIFTPPAATPAAKPRTPISAPAPKRPAPALPAAVVPQDLQPPVFHHGDDTVVVGNRSTLGWRRGPSPTEAESLERLARVTDAVSLAYLVIVPDEESGTRRLSKEHRAAALNLDQLLATVVRDALTGRQMRVAVEVFTATSPLQKHGVLRPAGALTDDDLPKGRTQYFDHSITVKALQGAAMRTIHAFHARNVEVLSTQYFFLSSIRLFDANTTGAAWDNLLGGARVTWVEIGPAKPADTDVGMEKFRRPPQIGSSPYGFHLISDRYDVVAMVREESAILYVYESSPVPASAPVLAPLHDEMPGSQVPGPTADTDPKTTDKKPRRWWPVRNSRR